MSMAVQSETQSACQIPHLETFSKAAELSSFTAAARELGLTQAAVSQRILALESELDVSLFDRTGGRVILTDLGRKLYDYAQRILELHRLAREELTGQKTVLSGELLLAASSIPGEHFLPAILSRFYKKYPEIRVRVEVADSDKVLEQIQKSQIPLGFVGRKSEESSLEFHPFGTDEMVVAVPRNHPWYEMQRVSLPQFQKEPLIVREVGSGTRWCLEQALSQVGSSLERMNITLELGSNEAIKEAISQGLGVSVLSHHAIQKELESGQLHAVRVSRLKMERGFYIVTDPQRALPLIARTFWEFLASDS